MTLRLVVGTAAAWAWFTLSALRAIGAACLWHMVPARAVRRRFGRVLLEFAKGAEWGAEQRGDMTDAERWRTYGERIAREAGLCSCGEELKP